MTGFKMLMLLQSEGVSAGFVVNKSKADQALICHNCSNFKNYCPAIELHEFVGAKMELLWSFK